jgi:hypothetical protein
MVDQNNDSILVIQSYGIPYRELDGYKLHREGGSLQIPTASTLKK